MGLCTVTGRASTCIIKNPKFQKFAKTLLPKAEFNVDVKKIQRQFDVEVEEEIIVEERDISSKKLEENIHFIGKSAFNFFELNQLDFSIQHF